MRSVNANTIRDITRRLTRACDRALAEAAQRYADGPAPELSIYEGYGSMTSHLAVVRSPDGHFYSFLKILLRSVAEEGFAEGHLRPVTTVYASRRAVLVRESLTSEPTRTFEEASLATAQEDDTLEYKASAWLDVRNWLKEGNQKSFSGGTAAIGKTVCGMLNNLGGLVVVGIGETERLRSRGEEGDATADQASRLGIPLTAGGSLLVLGLEGDFENPDRSGVTDWDSWRRELEDVLSNSVQPDPINLLKLVSVNSLELSDALEGRTLGIIEVSKPSDRRKWFYHEKKFYVRRAGRNELLEGHLAHQYQETVIGR